MLTFAFTGRIVRICGLRRGHPVNVLPGVLAPLALRRALAAASRMARRSCSAGAEEGGYCGAVSKFIERFFLQIMSEDGKITVSHKLHS